MIRQVSKLSLLLLGTAAISSCGNSSKKAQGADSTMTKTETTTTVSPPKENAPASTEFKAVPDSAILGKNSEALVKVIGAKSISLQDAEGKTTGSELTLNLSITNKSKLDNKIFFTVQSNDARLELDNSTSIPSSGSTGTTNPEPESTGQAEWKFNLPAGTQPKKLNFFLDGTRVSVSLEKK